MLFNQITGYERSIQYERSIRAATVRERSSWVQFSAP